MTDPSPAQELVGLVHALLFVSAGPVSVERLCSLTGASRDAVNGAVGILAGHYAAPTPGGVRLQEVAGGWMLTTAPEYADKVAALARSRPQPLSPAALETLAVIAYRQPVTRAEVEAVRGVKVEGVVATLLERGLVREAGRKPAPGRPVLYATTDEFLRFFGLRTLNDLPEPELQSDDDLELLPVMPSVE